MENEKTVKEICEILKVVIVALACPFAVPLISEIESEHCD